MNKKNKTTYTFGCKVNQVESIKIDETLFNYENKNIIVINTCTLTQKADAKCRNLVNRLLKKHSNKTIVITGCFVERNFEELQKKYKDNPNILLLLNKDKYKIPKILDLKKQNSQKNIYKYKSDKTRTFLKIQDGCDNFCTYCIVPYVRNKKWSMPIQDIESETKKTINNGFKEIVLTGIRIGFYKYIDEKGKTWKFEDVLENIAKNKKIKRIRISSIEPSEITDNIINIMSKNKNICPHLHIAIQSGDNDILKSMKRGYDTNYLIKLFSKLRDKIKNLRITVDLIIGYPGESDKNFKNTLDLLKKLEVDGIHIFPFSARKGTLAYNLKNKIPSHIINERKNILKNFDIKQRIKSLEKYKNTQQEVLFESNIKNGLISGYTNNYIKFIMPYKKGLENKFVKVELKHIDKKWPVFFRINEKNNK
jgi:threonylcarbamoyladenosine tRNA methylthiotransferase MtaB